MVEFSVPRAYCVYMVQHFTGQRCSSMYAYTYGLYASTWHTLVSAITTLNYVAIDFHRRVWYIAHFLCTMHVFEVFMGEVCKKWSL